MKKKQLHLWSTSLVVIAIVAASCSKGSPTSPSGGVELPNATGSVKVSINPNPVPFSGVPVTDTPGCATLPNTWFYDQVFTETVWKRRDVDIANRFLRWVLRQHHQRHFD